MPIGGFTKLSNVKINGFSDCDQRHIPDAEGRDNSVNMGIYIHAIVPRHVETVCLLSKLSEVKQHISVQVDMDELDLTAAESKATYEEIQAWVKEKNGFHVTHLNIAQVKQKHGIIERENYNKPNSPASWRPGCPEEKIQAIEAALKHFQMI